MKRFVTSDWHIGENRFEIMQRPFKCPEEMLDKLVENHNSLVNPEDLVYVLGDVVYQKTPEELCEVSMFNGRKILVRGNHDRVFTDDQLLKWFEQVVPEGDGIELDVAGIPIYMTHYPTKAVCDRFNLVGHIHSAWKVQLNSFNVGVDANHFYPHNLDEIVPFFLKSISEFYDEDVWAAYNIPNISYVGKRGKKSSYLDS